MSDINKITVKSLLKQTRTSKAYKKASKQKSKKKSGKNKKAGKKGQKSKNKNSKSLKLYVSGLPTHTTKPAFTEFLEQYGEVLSIKLPLRKNNGVKECKGHAKIEVALKATYNLFLDPSNEVKFEGEHPLGFEPYLKGENLVGKMLEIESRQVSVYAEFDIETDVLKRLFSIFGEVRNIAWNKKSSEDSFYGSIIFCEQNSAKKCLKLLEVHTEDGRKILIRPYLSQFKNGIKDKKGKEEKNVELKVEEEVLKEKEILNKEINLDKVNSGTLKEPVSIKLAAPELKLAKLAEIESILFKKIKLGPNKVVKGLSLEAQSKKYQEPSIRFNVCSQTYRNKISNLEVKKVSNKNIMTHNSPSSNSDSLTSLEDSTNNRTWFESFSIKESYSTYKTDSMAEFLDSHLGRNLRLFAGEEEHMCQLDYSFRSDSEESSEGFKLF